MSTQEFLSAQVQALQKRVRDLETELKLENENKRNIVTGLQIDIDELLINIEELVNVIKEIDPTNKILKHIKL